MATKIRGNLDIVAATITDAEISASAGIASTKLANWSADRNAGGYKLTNLAAPVSGNDAATKAYVDGVTAGLDYKEAVGAATNAVLSGTMIANNGTPATGERAYSTSAKTITWFSGEGPTTIDGVTLVNGDRILVKDETSTSGPSAGEGRQYNGIYVRTSADVWTRAYDMDGTPTNEISRGNAVLVVAGTTNTSSAWVLSTTNASDPDNINVDTETKNFVQYNASATYTPGDLIDIVGYQINVDLTEATTQTTLNSAADQIIFIRDPSGTPVQSKIAFSDLLKPNGGLVVESGQLAVDLGASSITGTLAVGDGGTGATSFTSNGVLYGNGSGAIQASAASTIAGAILYTASSGGAPSFTSTLTYNNTNREIVFVGGSGTLQSENQTASSTNSSLVTITSGQVDGTTSNSGQVSISTGASTTDGNTGSIVLRTGQATSGDSGNVTIGTGPASGTAGIISFQIADNQEAYIDAAGFNLSSGNVYKINNQTVVANSTADGQLMIGASGGGYAAGTLTAGSGINITNGTNSITIAVASTVLTSSKVKTQVFTGDGSTVAFDLTTPAYAATDNAIHVYLRGLRMRSGGVDFTITDTDTITFTSAPPSGDTIQVDYITA